MPATGGLRFVLLAGAGVLPTAVAAQAGSAPERAMPGTPPEVVVTAERLRGSAVGEGAPLAVLNPDAIRSLGATSITELIQRLRGLTTSSSGAEPVFLLNGRRISGFDEMRNIPPEALERTEVLPEQDAARFGFPPTVRVVNFVTRKRFRSVSAQQLAGATTDGGGETNYAEATATAIDGPRRTSLTASYFRQNPVFQSQRDLAPDPDTPFAVQGNLAAADGGSLDPRLDALAGRPIRLAALPTDPAARGRLDAYAGGAAVSDIGPYRTLVGRNDTIRVDGVLAGTLGRKVGGSLNLSMEARRVAGSNGLASAVLPVPAGSDGLPFARDLLLYRYQPDAVLRQRNVNLNLHAAATLQGQAGRWTWDVTGTHDRVRTDTRSDLGGPPGASSSDPAVAAQRVRLFGRTTTDTSVGKAVLNGPVARLPAGDALVTVNADLARSAGRARRPDAAPPRPGGPADLTRITRAASVAVEVPVASASGQLVPVPGRLSVNGRLGVTGVSDFGRLANVGYGLTWSPIRPVQLTASVSDARTPPAIGLLTDPLLFSPNTPFFDFVTGDTAVVTVTSGGNPALAPERRRITTLGVAVKPFDAREFRVNLDYLDTRVTDQTAFLGAANSDFQRAYPGRFVRDAAGRLVSADLRAVNVARETERKLRLGINLWTPLGPKPPEPPPRDASSPASTPPPPPARPRPTLYVNATGTWRLSDRLVLTPGAPVLDLLDGATLNGTEGRARWDVEGNVGGSIGPVNGGVFGRLRGAGRVASPLAASDLRFSGLFWMVLYTSLDAEKLTGRPWARRASVQVTVENLLNDRVNVRDRNGNTPNRFQGAFLDPSGRSIRLGARKLF